MNHSAVHLKHNIVHQLYFKKKIELKNQKIYNRNQGDKNNIQPGIIPFKKRSRKPLAKTKVI